MPNVGPLEIIIVFLIVILLFGVGRISKVSKELGSGIRAFKEGLQGDDDEEKEEPKPKESVSKDE